MGQGVIDMDKKALFFVGVGLVLGALIMGCLSSLGDVESTSAARAEDLEEYFARCPDRPNARGSYAIAWSNLQIAKELARIADALEYLKYID